MGTTTKWSFTEPVDTTDDGLPVRTQTLMQDGKPIAVISLHPCRPGSVTPEPELTHYQATNNHIQSGLINVAVGGPNTRKGKNK